jgi:uncharacterized coiled-coil protein SlyX
MYPLLTLIPRAAVFAAGMAMGALASRREQALSPALEDVKKRVAEMEARLTEQESRTSAHAVQLQEHEKLLAVVPSMPQIETAMDHLLERTMAALDERLGAQTSAIEVLKTTVAQTDSLLERVLESLDSLQVYSPRPDREEPVSSSHA